MKKKENQAYQYLLTLARLWKEEPDIKPSLERVGNEYGVNRSTVFRALAGYRRDGILDENYRLTPKGEEWLNSESQQIYRIERFLDQHDIPKEKQEPDAQLIVKQCSPETAMLFSNMSFMCNSCRRYVAAGAGKWSGMTGSAFLEQFGALISDGNYLTELFFRKESGGPLKERSMASEGFERTARLLMKNGRGVLRMKRKPLSHQSSMGRWYVGIADTVEYEREGHWNPLEIRDDIVEIPLSAFYLTYREDHGRIRGMARLRLGCSVGSAAMGRSAVLVEFRLWSGARLRGDGMWF